MEALTLFTKAASLAGQGLLIEAISKFSQLAEQYPDHELADDALFNAGICQFQLNNFEAAIPLLESVLERYPDGTIYTFENYHEHGKIAAKCHYALINCYLGLKEVVKANDQLEKLSAYTDSFTEPSVGEKITYYELGRKALKTYAQLNGN